jgi:hypothetical protein
MIHLPTVVSAGVLGWVSKGELFGPHRCGPSRSASVSLTYDPRSAGPPP